MANIRLTVRTLSRNDISSIATLLEQSFDYHLNHDSPFFVDYLCSLRTLVGLGLAAAFAEKSLLSIYQGYLRHFVEQSDGNFREAPAAKRRIAQSTAKMVGIAAISFRALKHPRYYEDFVKALHDTIAKIPGLTDRNSEAARILNGLQKYN